MSNIDQWLKLGEFFIYIVAIISLTKFIKNLLEKGREENAERIDKLEIHITSSTEKYDKHIAECNAKHEKANEKIEEILIRQLDDKSQDIKVLYESVVSVRDTLENYLSKNKNE